MGSTCHENCGKDKTVKMVSRTDLPLMNQFKVAGGLDFALVQFTLITSPGLYSDLSLVTLGPSLGRTVINKEIEKGFMLLHLVINERCSTCSTTIFFERKEGKIVSEMIFDAGRGK